jgi:hypothetical protein
MSIISEEMVEKAHASALAVQGSEIHPMRAALEAILPDIRNQVIEECAKYLEDAYIEDGEMAAADLRSLKTNGG